jgi:comEA protein
VPDLSTATHDVASQGRCAFRAPFQEDTMIRRTFLSAAVLAVVLCSAPLVLAQQRQKASPGAASTEMVNLNTATADQLANLPGIGPKTADLIIQYRTKNGPFKKIEELMNVRGIGEKSFLKLKSRLTVSTAKAE